MDLLLSCVLTNNSDGKHNRDRTDVASDWLKCVCAGAWYRLITPDVVSTVKEMST